MNPEYRVELTNINKVFYTHHFLQRDEESRELFFYRKKTVYPARQINFGIKPGEVFGLLGPNGAGKTTTVKMISGLIRPTSGSVYVDGLHVERMRLKALRKVGVVLEGTRTSIWPLTPLENLSYYGNLKDVRGKVLRDRAIELLRFIGLQDKMNVQVRKLSRGQKQKLAICIALIADPPVILLDEPTTGLDVQSNRSIKDKIHEMTREQGKSVLVTTHDMHVAQEVCDRIGIIHEGRLIACRPTTELIELFSDQTLIFSVDKQVETRSIASIPGVKSAEMDTQDGQPSLIVQVVHEADARSEAIYRVIEYLRAENYSLSGITQRKQNLENVFLRLTSDEHSVSTGGKE